MRRDRRFRKLMVPSLLGALLPVSAPGEVYRLPGTGNDLIGEIRYTSARHEETLIDIARNNSLGQDEIVMANPSVDRWLPKGGTKVVIPREFILPDAPRSGIVLNIPEMRLYYYPGQYETAAPKKPQPKPAAVKNADPKAAGKDAKNTKGKPPAKAPVEAAKPAPPAQPSMVLKSAPTQVITYPVSIGRMDWRTPLGATRVVEKVKDPVWRPPETIKKEHAKDGDILPDVVPAGPNNPLGQFAMKLGVPGYLIHGTGVDKAYGIGMRVTHGCIRMYPEDVAKLYPLVNVGTPVRLVNQPIKLGWQGEDLYMEVHQPLDEDRMSYQELLNTALALIEKKTANRGTVLNGGAVRKALEQPSGIPVLISKNPLASEPEISEPQVSERKEPESWGSLPQAPEPEPLEPAVSGPEVSARKLSPPDVSQPAPSSPEVWEPDSRETEAAERRASDLDPAQPVGAEPEDLVVPESEIPESETLDPETEI